MREPISETAPELDWEKLRPTLDEAMHELKEAEREAILLRFFENRPFAEVGGKLGLNENAARMRVERALEKLRAAFLRRVVAATAALASVISANAVQIAPAGLAATLTSTSLAAAGTGTLTLLKFMTLTKLKLGLSALVVAGATTALVIQHQTQEKLREENEALTQQLAQLKTNNESLSNSLAAADGSKSLSDEQMNELLKLRGEVGMLRKQVNEFQKSEQNRARMEREAAAKSEAEFAPAKLQFEANETKSVNDIKRIGIAFHLFAGDHQNQFPTNINEVDLSYFGSTNLIEFAQDQVELVNVNISNLKTYPQAILMRERMARQDPDGKWRRIYCLADGSVQTVTSDNGNFDVWEKQNTFSPPTNQ
jgi:hypothetical protein